MTISFDESAACRRVFESITRQVDLARKLGLTSSAVSNLKRRGNCTIELIIAAAEMTGKSVEWFLLGERGAGPNRGEEGRRSAVSGEVAGRRSAAHARRSVVAEQPAPYGGPEDLRRILRAFEDRLAAIEGGIRALETRLAALEQREKKPGAG